MIVSSKIVRCLRSLVIALTFSLVWPFFFCRDNKAGGHGRDSYPGIESSVRLEHVCQCFMQPEPRSIALCLL